MKAKSYMLTVLLPILPGNVGIPLRFDIHFPVAKFNVRTGCLAGGVPFHMKFSLTKAQDLEKNATSDSVISSCSPSLPGFSISTLILTYGTNFRRYLMQSRVTSGMRPFH
jgi:hypothetical protein